MTKEWIYRASKTELITELQSLGIETTGTIDDLRRRLSQYVSKHPEMFRATQPEEKVAEVPQISVPTTEERPTDETATRAIDQMRKWGCHFDGKDPIAFLERVDELKTAYGIAGPQLLNGLPELLKGDALLWYRNTRDQWRTWDEFCADFRDYYLPRRYRAKLVRKIQERLQTADETYRKFATELTTMMRRAGGYTPEEQLDMLYENMHPRYIKFIPRERLYRTGDLLRRADEIEDLEIQCRERQKSTKVPTAAATSYDRMECCWRCKQRGHTLFNCQRMPRKFCSQCGKDGVFTRECHPQAGNAVRTRDAADESRSPK